MKQRKCPHCQQTNKTLTWINEPENVIQCNKCHKFCELQNDNLEKRKFKTSLLYEYANTYRKNATDEDEIEQIDMTQEFYDEIDMMVKNGEIVIININAKPRMGKSTAGFAIGKYIFDKIKEHGYRESGQFGLYNIARDQHEYSVKMRNPDTKYTVIVQDEEDELEKGGENASVESGMNKVFSDIQAGRYVHRVTCSPREISDPNADILLDVITKDHITKIVHAKLYYRYFEAGWEDRRVLGYVNIDVGKIIKIWEEIKPRYIKEKQTREDKEIIEQYRKKDWYVEYMIRKYEKMDLITRYGIERPRELDYAGVIIEIIDDIESLAWLGSLKKSTIKNFVQFHMRRNKIPQSIVGAELSTNRVEGITDLIIAIVDLKKKQNKATDPETIEEIKRNKAKLAQKMEYQLKELHRYKDIHDKYHEVLN